MHTILAAREAKGGPDAVATSVYNGSPLEGCLQRLASMHRRLCPRQVLGVRIGLLATDLLELELPRTDKRLLAIVETDGCFADGVSVATGCWLGRRTLRLVDYGKVAVTFVDMFDHRAVRVWPSPLARVTAARYAPTAGSRWESQLLGYQTMPVEQLLCTEQVELAEPIASWSVRPGAASSARAAARKSSISVRS